MCNCINCRFKAGLLAMQMSEHAVKAITDPCRAEGVDYAGIQKKASDAVRLTNYWRTQADNDKARSGDAIKAKMQNPYLGEPPEKKDPVDKQQVIVKQQKQIDRMEGVIVKQQGDIQQARRERYVVCERMKKEYDELQAQNTALRQEREAVIQRLREKHEEVASMRKRLGGAVELASSELRNAWRATEQMQDQRDELARENSGLKSQELETQQNVRQMHQEFQDLMAAYRALMESQKFLVKSLE